jgi:hypothetical protein
MSMDKKMTSTEGWQQLLVDTTRIGSVILAEILEHKTRDKGYMML